VANRTQACRALTNAELLKAYERGARTITYWSHTWQYDGGEPDLTVVGT
jgi:hypothetical protein